MARARFDDCGYSRVGALTDTRCFSPPAYQSATAPSRENSRSTISC